MPSIQVRRHGAALRETTLVRDGGGAPGAGGGGAVAEGAAASEHLPGGAVLVVGHQQGYADGVRRPIDMLRLRAAVTEYRAVAEVPVVACDAAVVVGRRRRVELCRLT